MNWSERTKPGVDASEKRTLGEGVFRKCDGCGGTIRAEEFANNFEVCPDCAYHAPLAAERWIELLVDEGSFEERDADLAPTDPLDFEDTKSYRERLDAAYEATGVRDAILCGTAQIERRTVELGVFVFRFMGGSMGSVVGEKITRLMERAAEQEHAAIVLSCSGGARMHEGALSLMQMAKTVSALRRVRDAGVPFISVLLNPTTGGVAASYALLGDVNIAEPGALIGFAGPRVIKDTIREELPEGFQRAEFLLDHGMIDMIRPRQDMRASLSRLLEYLGG